MVGIGSSVGKGGMNNPSDVKVVQNLLNKYFKASTVPENGIVGPETITAIMNVQKKFMSQPDGRVDPNGATWRALNGAASPSRGPVMVTFQHFGHLPTGVVGLPGSTVTATATRYESSVKVAGGLSGAFKGSIYPDNMNVKGHLRDGTYDLYLGFHKPGTPAQKDLCVRTNGFRAVLVVNANKPVPVISNSPTKKTSEAIHVHNGYNHWTPAAPMSEGCLILHPNDWPRFIKLFLDAFPSVEDWTAGGGRLGKKIGQVIVRK
jgi:hypothetical protein